MDSPGNEYKRKVGVFFLHEGERCEALISGQNIIGENKIGLKLFQRFYKGLFGLNALECVRETRSSEFPADKLRVRLHIFQH